MQQKCHILTLRENLRQNCIILHHTECGHMIFSILDYDSLSEWGQCYAMHGTLTGHREGRAEPYRDVNVKPKLYCTALSKIRHIDVACRLTSTLCKTNSWFHRDQIWHTLAHFINFTLSGSTCTRCGTHLHTLEPDVQSSCTKLDVVLTCTAPICTRCG